LARLGETGTDAQEEEEGDGEVVDGGSDLEVLELGIEIDAMELVSFCPS